MSALAEELRPLPPKDDEVPSRRNETELEEAVGSDAVVDPGQCHRELPSNDGLLSSSSCVLSSPTAIDMDSLERPPGADDSTGASETGNAASERKRRGGPRDADAARERTPPRTRKRTANHNDPTPELEVGAEKSRIPIHCRHLNRDVFRVVRARGKSLASGGFGFVVVRRGEPTEKEGRHSDESVSTDPRAATSSAAVVPTEHLFLEEVLFLHERGLLECRDPDDRRPTSAGNGDQRPSDADAAAPAVSLAWDSFRLYSLLNRDDTVSLPVYLVYAHLRKQGFRVVRHTPNRRALLVLGAQGGGEGTAPESNAESDEEGRQSSSDQRRRRRLQLALREDAATAVPPKLCSLAWDVYRPNSQFRRANPGLPDFYAAVAMYSLPMRMQRVWELVEECAGIPFQIGSVSESGQVVMMGIHEFASPTIERPAPPNATTAEET